MVHPRSLRSLLRSQSSVSEVLGTVLLTATTVVLLGGFGVVLLTSVDGTNDPPTGSFAVDSEEGASTVDVRFVAGTAFRLEDVDVVLLVNGTRDEGPMALVDPAVAGTFSPGGTLRFTLASGPLPADADLMVLVVDRESGKPVGSTVNSLLSASTLPPFVTGIPSIAGVSFDPPTLVVDGASISNVSVQAVSPFGLDLVRTVTLNLTSVGGAADVVLRDDGQGPDALAGDGIYSAQVVAVQYDFPGTPGVATVNLPVTLGDVFGKLAQGDGTLSLQTSPQSKVATGAKYRNLPPSGSVDYVNLTDLTYRDESALDNDQVQVRVSDLSGTSNVWTALVTFASPATCGGLPGVASVQLSRDGVAGSATFTPTSGCLSLGALSKLNIADPVSSLDATGATTAWTITGSASTFLYSAAGIGATNEAVVTFFGDSVSPAPSAVGLGGADLEWARFSGSPPTASFTASTTLLTTSVDASGSIDRHGGGLTYAWDWGDGSTGAGVTASHAYATGGTYQVTLTVTDGAGATSTTSAAVSPNRPPVASFTASTLLLVLSVDSSASSDPDGQALTRSWDWGDGTPDGAGTTATHAYAAPGTYTVTLTVTDTLGASSTSTVVVSAGNVGPTAGLSANVTTGVSPLDVSLSLSGSDADGAIASWSLSYGDGGSETGTALPATRTRQYLAGTYQANLTVIDDDGASHTATVTITVGAANVAPAATLGSNATGGTAPLDVGFTLAGSDPDGSIASWTLTFGDGTQTTGTSLPATASRQYAVRGTYQAHLHVVDDDGAVAGSSVNVTVNGRPTASFLVTGTSGLQVDVDGSASSDPGGSVVQYNWDWGDGSSSTTTTPTTSRFYATGGTYTITLTVTDDFGATSAAVSAIVTPNRAPVIASLTRTGGSDLNATMTTSASDDDGQALTYTYAWGDGTATGTAATQSHQYAQAGNHTVTVYVNDTMGGSASATQLVTVTQTIYAAPTDTSFATPGGSVTSIGNVAGDDGLSATFTETNTGSTVSAATGCDSTFTTQAPLSCTLSSLTWKVNTTSTGGTAGWAMALDASQGTPTADGALSFSPTSNGANTGRLNYHFNLTGASGTTLTNLALNWKMTANGGTGPRSITAVLVAPNGTAVTIGTASATANTAWSTFTGNVADNFLTSPGTYLLRLDYLSNKNGDVLNLDNLYLNWTATNTYRLQKELSLSPVPTAPDLSHHLEVKAAQGANAETLHVQVFDGSAWTTRASVTGATMTTYVVKLTAAELNGGNVRVRLADATTSSDPTASTWLVDHARIVVRGA